MVQKSGFGHGNKMAFVVYVDGFAVVTAYILVSLNLKAFIIRCVDFFA